MANKKSIGLPGGPNEYITDISEYLSVEGYKFNSPDVDNPFNIIESGSITMEDVEFPVLGTDNLGNTQMMQPGMTYEFPGNMVFETPMAKSGGSVSWKWKGKSYSGTLIPSMETSKARYARTKNGKIKTLPKAQDGNETVQTEFEIDDRSGKINTTKGYDESKLFEFIKDKYKKIDTSTQKNDLVNKLSSPAFRERYKKNIFNITGENLSDEELTSRINSQVDFTAAGPDFHIKMPFVTNSPDSGYKRRVTPYIRPFDNTQQLSFEPNAGLFQQNNPEKFGDITNPDFPEFTKYPYIVQLADKRDPYIMGDRDVVPFDIEDATIVHEYAHSYNTEGSPLFRPAGIADKDGDGVINPNAYFEIDRGNYNSETERYDYSGSYEEIPGKRYKNWLSNLFGEDYFTDTKEAQPYGNWAMKPWEVSSIRSQTENKLKNANIWDNTKGEFNENNLNKMLRNDRYNPVGPERMHLDKLGFTDLERINYNKSQINKKQDRFNTSIDRNSSDYIKNNIIDTDGNRSVMDIDDFNIIFNNSQSDLRDKQKYSDFTSLVNDSKVGSRGKKKRANEILNRIYSDVKNQLNQEYTEEKEKLQNTFDEKKEEVLPKMKMYFNEIAMENPNQPVVAKQGKEQLPEAQFGLLKNALKPTVKYLKKYLTKADDVVPGKNSEVNFIDNVYKQQLKDVHRIVNTELYNAKNPPTLQDLVSHYNKQSDDFTSVYRYGFDGDFTGSGAPWYSADLGDPLRYQKYKRGDGVFKADVPNDILRESYRGNVNNADAAAGKIPGLDPRFFHNALTNFKEFRFPEGLASAFQDQKFGKKTIEEYIDYLRSLKQTGGTIREYNPPGFFENIGDIFANPITAFGYTARGEDIPEGLNVNNPNRNNFDMVADIFNPFAWYQYGENAYNDFSKGEYLDGTLNALGALPVVPATIVAAKNLKTPLQKIAGNTNRLLSNANTNIKSGVSGVRPPTSNRPFTQYWDGKNWVSSSKEQAINNLENLQNQYKTLKNNAYNKVKGAESELKRVEGKMQGLLDDFERQGFDTKELKDDAFMNMFKEYNLFKRGAKDQKRIISDMTDEFYEMRDFYKGESGGYDDLLEQITKGEKLDADLIKKHLDKSLWERIKNLGETLPGGPGDGPGLRLQQGGSMPSRSQIIDEQNKKNNQVLGLTNIIDYMVESRGGNEKTWTDLADNIAFHESGPEQRMNPQARQITKGGKKDGLGRGMFQFEPESFETAKIRYKNVADAVGYKLDENILNAESALDLNAKDQYTLFFANLIESPAVLKDYADGKSSMADVWLKGHKNVSKKGNRKSFANSVEAAKKELGKTGFLQFSLEDLLPYRKGGESDMLDTYRNYINGKVRSQEAVNVYDKLNRIHLNDARRMGMTVPNYIMTHL